MGSRKRSQSLERRTSECWRRKRTLVFQLLQTAVRRNSLLCLLAYLRMLCQIREDWLTITDSMKKSLSWGANRSSTSQLTELYGSLSHSQEPASCSYPKPDQSSPRSQLNSSKFILIVSSYLRLRLPCGLFPSGFPTKTLHAPLLSPVGKHAPTSSLFAFYHPYNIW